MSAPETTTRPKAPTPDRAPGTPASPAAHGLLSSLRSARLVHRRAILTSGILVVAAAVVTFGLYLWQRLAPDRERCMLREGEMASGDRLKTLLECEESLFGYEQAASWYRLLGTEMDGWIFAPVLLGALFAAGPLIARELEAGTFRLAWTQAETPRSWLTGRLVLAAVVATVVGVVSVGLFRFVRATSTETLWAWSQEYTFPALGPVLVSYLVLGVAVGALAGLVLRRVLPAMAATTVLTGGCLVAFHQVRMYLWPSKSVEWALSDKQQWPMPGHAHVIDYGLLKSSGERLARDFQPCDALRFGSKGGDKAYEACLADRGITGRWADYHPQSHFWPLQLVETALVLAVAAAVVFIALRVLRRLVP
ncbi:ABC transporter permease [Streptomyces sp. JNUCC 64]